MERTGVLARDIGRDEPLARPKALQPAITQVRVTAMWPMLRRSRSLSSAASTDRDAVAVF